MLPEAQKHREYGVSGEMRKVIIEGDDLNWIKADLNGGANDED